MNLPFPSITAFFSHDNLTISLFVKTVLPNIPKEKKEKNFTK